jgi:hypothetical protein
MAFKVEPVDHRNKLPLEFGALQVKVTGLLAHTLVPEAFIVTELVEKVNKGEMSAQKL